MRPQEGFPREGAGQEENSDFPALVRAELARILRSEIFTRAPSLSRFLRHLVEQTLTGNPHLVTEYSLGIDVFDRGQSFDPTTDTIVRVQARRLRSKLEAYYKSEGQSDPVVIELPKGQYVVIPRLTGPPDDRPAPGSLFEELRGLRVGLPPPLPLPTAWTSFVGREKELAEVKQLITSDHVHLLTLTGAGGSGKTRLALQIAGAISSDFPGGIYMVPLASVMDSETVASTIAQSVGLRHTGGQPLPKVLPLYLSIVVQKPTLLFIDNFEQVIEAAPLLTTLLSGCPALKVLATSRELLRVSGEHEYPVPSLPKPDPKQPLSVQQLMLNPAVALFVQRAREVNASFTLNDENASAVAGICAYLDGLPLAIELAAARVKVLPPAAMLQRLDSSLDLLTSGNRDWPARQQTLRKTVEWSHNLLTVAEQRLFRRLGVFARGCTLESVEAVCNTRWDLGISVLDGISGLLNKNLLKHDDRQVQQDRFAMLETIREYALEKLQVSGELEATRRAYAAYCLVLAEEGAAQDSEEDRKRWLTVWDAEHDNLRDALDWLIEIDNGPWAFRLGTALLPFWQRREHFAEGRERLEAILRLKTAASPTRDRAKAGWYAAILADHQGDFTSALRLQQECLRVYTVLGDKKGIAGQLCYVGQQLRQTGHATEARLYFEQSVAACRQLGNRAAIAMAANNFGEFLTGQGEYELARSLFEEALSIFRALRNDSGAGWCLNHLGDAALRQKDFTEAGRLYSEAYRIFSSVGDSWGMARSLADLGRLALEQNDYNGAHSSFEQALKSFLRLNHTRGVASVLEGLASLAVHERHFERALTLAAIAEGLRQKVGLPQRPTERKELDLALQSAWEEVPESTARTIWAEGLRMTTEDAIAYALCR